MRRLYLQIYVTFLGILLLFGVLVSLASLLIPVQSHDYFDGLGVVLSELLPGPDRPVAELQAAVQHLGQLLHINLAVRSPDGILLAAVGSPPPAPSPAQRAHGWMRVRGAGPTVVFPLPDGRLVVARWRPPHHVLGWLG